MMNREECLRVLHRLRGKRGSDSNGAESHAKRRFPDSLGVGGLALDPRSRIGTYRRD